MTVTAKNSKAVLLVCLAYTSTDEIVHAVQESCKQKSDEIQALNACKSSNDVIKGEENVKKNSLMAPDVEEFLARNGMIGGVEGTEWINGVTVCTLEDEARGSKASKIGNGVIEGIYEKQREHPILKLVDVEK